MTYYHPPGPTVPCCDLCDPSLLNKTRPGTPPVVARQTTVKRGQASEYTQQKLVDWRTSVLKRDFSGALFASSAIMTDETVQFLSSVGRLSSREHLKNVLAGQWKWETRYGNELHTLLAAPDIPLMNPLPRKTRGTKRSAEEVTTQDPGVFTFQPILTPSAHAASSSRGKSSSQAQKRSRIDDDQRTSVPVSRETGTYYVPTMAQHPPYSSNPLHNHLPPEAYDPRFWYPYTPTLNPYFAPAAPNPPAFQFHNTFGNPNTPPK